MKNEKEEKSIYEKALETNLYALAQAEILRMNQIKEMTCEQCGIKWKSFHDCKKLKENS